MTVRRPRSHPASRIGQDDWGRVVVYQDETTKGNVGGYVVAALTFAALLVLCLAGFLLMRLLNPDRVPPLLPSFSTWTPTPDHSETVTSPALSPTTAGVSERPSVMLDPTNGYINTLVTVTGEGWWPGEPVFVFLRSPEEAEGQGYSYAAAVADDRGSFRTALTFPNETRWIGLEWADVIARGTRSGNEANIRFTILAPTPTSTLPPPTALPTRAPTETPTPTSTPLPTNTPMPSPTPEDLITDWRAEYFAGVTPAGDPILVRNDIAIDFNWGLGSPGWGIPDDGFSARWTRRLHFDEGMYRFTVLADDGVRIWSDGRFLLDEWHDSTQETYAFDWYMPAGEHALQVEFFENLGGARVYVAWAKIEAESPEPTVVPTDTPVIPTEPTVMPFPTPTPLPPLALGWWGEYYANVYLEGPAVLTRLDPVLDFNWGTGSPGMDVPADDFSARWTQLVSLPAGTYQYWVQADDGARFWLDSQLLIDAWPANPSETYSAQVYVPAGFHILTVEYFEITIDAQLRFWSEAVP